LEPVQITPTTLDNNGTAQSVQWYEAHDAQRTLGAFLAPGGSFHKQLDILQGHLDAWQECLRNMHAANLQAKWLSYKTVFLKKILFPLIGHTCGEDDLHFLQQPVDREVLHILGLNEHFPRAVLRAPLLYGGMGCANIHAQHVIEKLLLFVHHIRENGQIKEALLASMSVTQLECGVSQQFFSLSAAIWNPLATPTWVTSLWRDCNLKGIDIKFHTDSFWVPKAIREHDVCIMEVASSLYQGQQLVQINMCRIHLQVTYLSDITSVDGKRILLAYYEGKEHQASGRQSRLHWPPIGELPKTWWDLWKQFLERWCGTALHVPTSLGGWYEGVEILTRCCCFLHERRLIMQHKENWFEFFPVNSRSNTRFIPTAHQFYDLHLLSLSKVVDITYKHKCIYVIYQSEQNIISQPSSPQSVHHLQDLYRDLSPELQRIVGSVEWPPLHELVEIATAIDRGTAMGVSDGSVRTTENRASHAWIIHTPTGSEIKGMGPVDGTSEARSSHRAELQGQTALFLMISMFLQYFKIFGGKVATYCDNQPVVTKVQQGWRRWRYCHTKGADGDLQVLLCQTINGMRRHSDFNYTSEWVQSHQDKNADISALPREVALNVRMDRNTKEAYSLPAQWQTQDFVPVLRAEGCAVYINNNKLTSNMHLSLLERWHEKEAKEYLVSRHKFNESAMHSIYWQSLRHALNKLSPHRKAIAVKAIHRHLPTQDKLYKQGRVTFSAICPRCLQEAETNGHVFRCTNNEALKQRKEDWVDLWKELNKGRTATVIEQTWRSHLQPLLDIPLGISVVETMPVVYGETEALLQFAIHEQSAIGWDKLLLGMGAVSWKTLQDFIDTNNPRPPQRSATDWMHLAARTLLKFSIRCWKSRNHMIHGTTNQEQRQIALQNVRDQITHIYNNPPQLAPHFRSIFEIPLAHRLKMPLHSAEQWISLIRHQEKVTKHNFKILLSQHRPMATHFRTMRKEARQQAKDRALPVTPRKAHRREVQAANQRMREKLYAPIPNPRTKKQSTRRPKTQVQRPQTTVHPSQVVSSPPHSPLRQHPP
jgi:hypothetical protein